jgi:two-component system sensor histidine kinase CpxA
MRGVNKLQYILGRLNPVNSLFGKIVIWFWLSITSLVITAFVLSRLIAPSVDISQPSEAQSKQAEKTAQLLEVALARGVPLERALRRLSGRGQWQLIALNPMDSSLKTSIPQQMLPAKKALIDLAEATQVLLVRTPKFELIGPITVNLQDNEFKLFAARLLKREERQPASFGIGIAVVLLLGSLLCLLLAWRLTKPIGELRKATQLFASGNLNTPFTGAKRRKDEIGHLADDFSTMADKLSASMHQQQMLMANVSHELRTPLTRLQLAVAMLQDKKAETQDKYLARIEQDIGQMDALIAQILTLSRIENANNGLTSDQTHRFDRYLLPDLLKPVLESLEFEANANDITLSCNDIPNIEMYVHAETILSAFENIARNAIKFSRSKVTIELSEHDKRLIVSVEDDGHGLAQEELDKLFSPFYRAHHSAHNSAQASDSATGSGLGLAIAKAAVSLHHGELVATRSLLGGLKLTMTLPISEA